MKTTAYFAYQVRGRDGDHVDPTTKRENVARAIEIADQLALWLPHWHIYVPHKHEPLIEAAWYTQKVSTDDILSMCCDVVKCCDVFILGCSPQESEGVELETIVANDSDMYIWELYRQPFSYEAAVAEDEKVRDHLREQYYE